MKKYEFKPTGNKVIDKIITNFDKQIRREYRKAEGVKEQCESYWGKLLFLETLNIQPHEWKTIRGGDYWKKISVLQYAERMQFMYNAVMQYKQDKP